MGYRKAFGGDPGRDGKPGTVYLQINRTSFLEIAQATDAMPAGITHVGLQVPDEDGLVAALRGRGATVTDPRVSPALSKSKLANLNDPNAIRWELTEAIPGSVLKQVEDSWNASCPLGAAVQSLCPLAVDAVACAGASDNSTNARS